MNRRITEQNEDSLSLNDDTVIQEYNNLDYSDEHQPSLSAESQENSLSSLNLERFQKLVDISKIQKQPHRESHHRPRDSRPSNERMSFKSRRGEDSKYHLGISPSTKEEYSLLNPPPRLSHQNHDISAHLRENHQKYRSSHHDEYASHGDFSLNSEENQCNHRDSEAGHNRIGESKKNFEQFDIDNFLNAHPVPLKNKKGIKVLAVSNQDLIKEKYKISEKKVIPQEESIVLVTLPQKSSIYYDRDHNNSKVIKVIHKNQEQLSKINGNYERRFKETRLNFIDTFLPDSMKIKRNPYNLLKYINNKSNL